MTHKMTNSLIWLQDLIFYDYQLGHWDNFPLFCSFIITLCLFGEEKERLKDLDTPSVQSVCKWCNINEKKIKLQSYVQGLKLTLTAVPGL